MKTRHARRIRYLIKQVSDIRTYQQRNPGSPLRDLIASVEWPLSKQDRQAFREIIRRTRP